MRLFQKLRCRKSSNSLKYATAVFTTQAEDNETGKSNENWSLQNELMLRHTQMQKSRAVHFGHMRYLELAGFDHIFHFMTRDGLIQDVVYLIDKRNRHCSLYNST